MSLLINQRHILRDVHHNFKSALLLLQICFGHQLRKHPALSFPVTKLLGKVDSEF